MRIFTEHCKRKVADLSGVWGFAPDKEKMGDTHNWQKCLPVKEKFAVPGMWNNESGYILYEGMGWYEKKFYTDGGTLRFWFGGVQTEATVWFDGELLGTHYGGFCEFSFIKTGVEEGWHTLTVRADNSFDADSIPQTSVDWWHYGGITREIVVETLKGICPLYNRVEYTLSEDRKKATIKQIVELYNAEAETKTDVVKYAFGDISLEKKVTLEAGEEQTIEFDFTIENVRLWDVDSPYLYDIAISTSTDDLFDRTGLRHVEVKPDGVYLNGKFVEIRGVCRHEEHPEWGFAFPLKLMKKDLDIAMSANVNAIRGSHYPNSRAFLDYCDENGILFWSEIPIWGCGFEPATIAREKVVSRIMDMHREMVRYYYNYPSIVFWGMFNELPTDTKEGVALAQKCYPYLKENGGNRMVTYASNCQTWDECLPYCDIICLNVYWGWYGGDKYSWDKFLEDYRAFRKKKGMEHKPVIMSEFGAGALFGYKTHDCIPWTEEYQADLIGYALELFHKDPMMCGVFIWQYTDIRSCNEINRARGFNNKGILNEYRNPKLSYFKVKEMFTKFKEEEKNK